MEKNREIKFRAWHTEQKRMFEVYGLGPDFVTENTFDGVNPGTNAFCGDDMNFINIMQFTGLKDKNGVDIYEGDVMQPSSYKAVDWLRGHVIYKNGFFNISGTNWGSSTIYQQLEMGNRAKNHIVVIGNIYENPELLKP